MASREEPPSSVAAARGAPPPSSGAARDAYDRRMEVVVRRTRADDWAEVRDLRLEMLGDTPMAFLETAADARSVPEAMWRSRADRGQGPGTVLAAIDESGRWLGTMAGYLERRSRPQPYLASVYVTPDARGRRSGVSDLLLAGILDWAAENGGTLGLLVHEDNARAIRFYVQRGFHETGHRTPYPLDRSRDEIELLRSAP